MSLHARRASLSLFRQSFKTFRFSSPLGQLVDLSDHDILLTLPAENVDAIASGFQPLQSSGQHL